MTASPFRLRVALAALAVALCPAVPTAAAQATGHAGGTPANHGAAPAPSVLAPSAPAARAHPADAMFMQMMIPHHAQALELSSLVRARTGRVAIHRLAERIAVSQFDEIAQMQRWLREHAEALPAIASTIPLTADAVAAVATPGSPAPTPAATASAAPTPAACAPEHAAMGHCTPAAASASEHAGMDPGTMDHSRMPGMLSPEQMADLAAARGDAFDRKFLVYMTAHHEGALTMVRDLFAAPGAAQTTFVYRFATDVDGDQRADIRRMNALLAALPPETPAPGTPASGASAHPRGH